MKTVLGLGLACLLRRSKGWCKRPNIPIDEAEQRRTDTRRLLTVLLATAIFSSAQIAMAQGPPINTDTPVMLGVQEYTHLSSKTKPMMPTLTLVHPWKVRLIVEQFEVIKESSS